MASPGWGSQASRATRSGTSHACPVRAVPPAVEGGPPGAEELGSKRPAQVARSSAVVTDEGGDAFLAARGGGGGTDHHVQLAPVHASGMAAPGAGLASRPRWRRASDGGCGGGDGGHGPSHGDRRGRPCPEIARPESLRRIRAAASPDEEDGHEHHGDDLPPHRFR